MAWQKQALHGEISKPERISHPVRHKLQQLFADGYSQLTVARIIAEGIIRPQHAPNGGERLVHRRKRFGIVYVRSEIWRGHYAAHAVIQAGARRYSLSHQWPTGTY